MAPKLLSSSTIDGMKVINKSHEDIGKLKDLMIDWNNGNVAYAEMSFGGFLGIGDKYFAIPLDAFSFEYDDGKDYAVLNVSKEQLENAPGFDKDNWPKNADYTFIDSVHTHYGYDSYSERYPPKTY